MTKKKGKESLTKGEEEEKEERKGNKDKRR